MRACILEWKGNINGGSDGGWWDDGNAYVCQQGQKGSTFMHCVDLSPTNNTIAPFAFFLFWVARIPT